jgi:hypothetical protein
LDEAQRDDRLGISLERRHGDGTTFEFPAEPTVLFLANPFRDRCSDV